MLKLITQHISNRINPFSIFCVIPLLKDLEMGKLLFLIIPIQDHLHNKIIVPTTWLVDTNSTKNFQEQERSPSLSVRLQAQRENQEGIDRLQSEIFTLKTLLEKLIEGNGERNRQVDAVPMTSSYCEKLPATSFFKEKFLATRTYESRTFSRHF